MSQNIIIIQERILLTFGVGDVMLLYVGFGPNEASPYIFKYESVLDDKVGGKSMNHSPSSKEGEILCKISV